MISLFFFSESIAINPKCSFISNQVHFYYRPYNIIIISSQSADSKAHCLLMSRFFTFLYSLCQNSKIFEVKSDPLAIEFTLNLIQMNRKLRIWTPIRINNLPSHLWQHILPPILGLFQTVSGYKVPGLLAWTSLQASSMSPFTKDWLINSLDNGQFLVWDAPSGNQHVSCIHHLQLDI